MKKQMMLMAGLVLVFILLEDSLFGQPHSKSVDQELWKKAERIHQDAVVIDAHAHRLFFGQKDKKTNYPKAKQLDISQMKKGSVDGLALYFGGYPIKGKTLYSKVKDEVNLLHQRIRDYSADVTVASDIPNFKRGVEKGDLVVLPGIEYFYGALNGKFSTVDSLYDLGIRVMMLMDNEYERLSYENGNSNGSRNLNVLALRTIEKMNERGMLIDITHLDDQMQEKVIDHSDLPVIASHSSTRHVHNVPRNIPDHIIKKLAKKGGNIMITFNSGNLAGVEKGRCKIEWLIDHIDHAVKVAGIDHVGIGSDFNGAGLRSPVGLEDASGFPLITYHLLKRGYTENEIKKIMGENYLSLLSRVMNSEKKSFSDNMVYVEGGRFMMGDVWDKEPEEEAPSHEVKLSSFYISKYEVTQKQFEQVMKRNPSVWKGDNLPVDYVTWYDAIFFCNRLSK
jgi:membrane dipeptidase